MGRKPADHPVEKRNKGRPAEAPAARESENAGFKTRFIGYANSFAGSASVISNYTLCHQVCMGLIAVMGMVGITVVGMPLAFLSRYTMFLWGLGVAMLGVTVMLYYFHKGCIRGHLLVMNAGILIAGIPFEAFLNYQRLLWLIGGFVIAGSIGNWIWNTRIKKSCCQTTAQFALMLISLYVSGLNVVSVIPITTEGEMQ